MFSDATKAWLQYNSPLDYVRTMKHTFAAYPLRVFLYVGNHDGDASPVAPMAAALLAAGADVHSAVYPGGHDWNLWSARLDQMLVLASGYFATAVASSPAA